MWTRWKHHVVTAGILAVVGTLTIIRPLAWTVPGASIWMDEQVPGTLGTRFFGYGALALLGLALSLGPLARLWPRRFARLIPYRRAIGIWSTLAGVVHLLFVLQLVGWEFYHKDWFTLFLHRYTGYDVNGSIVIRYGLRFEPVSVVAWTGLLALLLLLLVALVSSDRALRFLGQPSWKLVQQWAYTGFLFIALHLLVMKYGGKLKMSPPLARWATWLLLAVALLQAAGFVYTVWKHRSRSSGSDRHQA